MLVLFFEWKSLIFRVKEEFFILGIYYFCLCELYLCCDFLLNSLVVWFEEGFFFL